MNDYFIQVCLSSGEAHILGKDVIGGNAEDFLSYPEDFASLRPLDVIIRLKQKLLSEGSGVLDRLKGQAQSQMGHSKESSGWRGTNNQIAQSTPLQFQRLANNNRTSEKFQRVLDNFIYFGECKEGLFIEGLCDRAEKLRGRSVLKLSLVSLPLREQDEAAQDFVSYVLRNRSFIFVDVNDYANTKNNYKTMRRQSSNMRGFEFGRGRYGVEDKSWDATDMTSTEKKKKKNKKEKKKKNVMAAFHQLATEEIMSGNMDLENSPSSANYTEAFVLSVEDFYLPSLARPDVLHELEVDGGLAVDSTGQPNDYDDPKANGANTSMGKPGIEPPGSALLGAEMLGQCGVAGLFPADMLPRLIVKNSGEDPSVVYDVQEKIRCRRGEPLSDVMGVFGEEGSPSDALERSSNNLLMAAQYVLNNISDEEIDALYLVKNEDGQHTAVGEEWQVNIVQAFRDEEALIFMYLERRLRMDCAVDVMEDVLRELHPEHDGNILHDAAMRNFVMVVHSLREYYPGLYKEMMLETDQHGYTSMQYAAESGSYEMCACLWHTRESRESKEGEVVLQLQLPGGPPPSASNETTNFGGSLGTESLAGVVAKVLNARVPTFAESREAAINQGTVYPFCIHGRTPLHGASFFGYTDIIRGILEHPLFLSGLSPDVASFCMYGHFNRIGPDSDRPVILHSMTSEPLDPGATNRKPQRPADILRREEDPDRFHSVQADIFCSGYMQDASQRSVLHHACMGGHEDAVALIIMEFICQNALPTNEAKENKEGRGDSTQRNSTVQSPGPSLAQLQYQNMQNATRKRLLNYLRLEDIERHTCFDLACGVYEQKELRQWFVQGKLQQELRVLGPGIVLSQGTDSSGICRARFGARELIILFPPRSSYDVVKQLKWLLVDMLERSPYIACSKAQATLCNVEGVGSSALAPRSSRSTAKAGDTKRLIAGLKKTAQKVRDDDQIIGSGQITPRADEMPGVAGGKYSKRLSMQSRVFNQEVNLRGSEKSPIKSQKNSVPNISSDRSVGLGGMTPSKQSNPNLTAPAVMQGLTKRGSDATRMSKMLEDWAAENKIGSDDLTASKTSINTASSYAASVRDNSKRESGVNRYQCVRILKAELQSRYLPLNTCVLLLTSYYRERGKIACADQKAQGYSPQLGNLPAKMIDSHLPKKYEFLEPNKIKAVELECNVICDITKRVVPLSGRVLFLHHRGNIAIIKFLLRAITRCLSSERLSSSIMNTGLISDASAPTSKSALLPPGANRFSTKAYRKETAKLLMNHLDKAGNGIERLLYNVNAEGLEYCLNRVLNDSYFPGAALTKSENPLNELQLSLAHVRYPGVNPAKAFEATLQHVTLKQQLYSSKMSDGGSFMSWICGMGNLDAVKAALEVIRKDIGDIVNEEVSDQVVARTGSKSVSPGVKERDNRKDDTSPKGERTPARNNSKEKEQEERETIERLWSLSLNALRRIEFLFFGSAENGGFESGSMIYSEADCLNQPDDQGLNFFHRAIVSFNMEDKAAKGGITKFSAGGATSGTSTHQGEALLTPQQVPLENAGSMPSSTTSKATNMMLNIEDIVDPKILYKKNRERPISIVKILVQFFLHDLVDDIVLRLVFAINSHIKDLNSRLVISQKVNEGVRIIQDRFLYEVFFAGTKTGCNCLGLTMSRCDNSKESIEIVRYLSEVPMVLHSEPSSENALSYWKETHLRNYALLRRRRFAQLQARLNCAMLESKYLILLEVIEEGKIQEVLAEDDLVNAKDGDNLQDKLPNLLTNESSGKRSSLKREGGSLKEGSPELGSGVKFPEEAPRIIITSARDGQGKPGSPKVGGPAKALGDTGDDHVSIDGGDEKVLSKKNTVNSEDFIALDTLGKQLGIMQKRPEPSTGCLAGCLAFLKPLPEAREPQGDIAIPDELKEQYLKMKKKKNKKKLTDLAIYASMISEIMLEEQRMGLIYTLDSQSRTVYHLRVERLLSDGHDHHHHFELLLYMANIPNDTSIFEHRDSNGNTVLHYCAANGSVTAINIMKLFFNDVPRLKSSLRSLSMVVDKNQYSPKVLAERRGNTNFVKAYEKEAGKHW